MTPTYPTERAWNYFMLHHDDIRECVSEFLPVAQWQSMVGPFGAATQHTLTEFDKAVEAKDSRKLSDIMNDAWGRAPESRDVYRIPGFTELCNLLDGTVDGFDGEDYDSAADEAGYDGNGEPDTGFPDDGVAL